MRNVTSFRVIGPALVLAAAIGAQDKSAQENLTARNEGSLTANGTFKAVVLITGSGVRSDPYREAFSLGKAGAAAPTLFGRFMLNRRFQSAPEIIDADNLQRPVQIRFPVRKDDLILPFQRQASLSLDLFPFRLTAAPQPDGSLSLGRPGKLHEEITLAVPPEFALPLASQFSVERPVARYQSEWKVDGRTLIIVRELELKQESVRGSDRVELESLSKTIQEDQQRPLTLRRIGRLDAKTTPITMTITPTQNIDWLLGFVVNTTMDYGIFSAAEGTRYLIGSYRTTIGDSNGPVAATGPASLTFYSDAGLIGIIVDLSPAGALESSPAGTDRPRPLDLLAFTAALNVAESSSRLVNSSRDECRKAPESDRYPLRRIIGDGETVD